MLYKEKNFEIEDLYKVLEYSNQIQEVDYVRNNPVEIEIYLSKPGFRTLMYGDDIVCIFGCPYGGYRTYVPTMIPGKCMKHHLRRVIKFLYRYFITNVPPDVQRLEAAVDAEDKVALRFAKYFGFGIIGIRHNSCPNGHDQAILERLCCKTTKEGLVYDDRFIW